MDDATCRVLDAVTRRLKHLHRRRGLPPLARAYRITLHELIDAPPTGNPRVQCAAPSRDDSVIVPLTRR